jgi:hypothetical protein
MRKGAKKEIRQDAEKYPVNPVNPVKNFLRLCVRFFSTD